MVGIWLVRRSKENGLKEIMPKKAQNDPKSGPNHKVRKMTNGAQIWPG